MANEYLKLFVLGWWKKPLLHNSSFCSSFINKITADNYCTQPQIYGTKTHGPHKPNKMNSLRFITQLYL